MLNLILLRVDFFIYKLIINERKIPGLQIEANLNPGGISLGVLILWP